jgi:hypothetical protein
VITVFTATAIGLAVAALILFFTALILFFQWDIPAARRELKGQAFTDTVETLTSTLSSDGAVEAYRKMSALSLGEHSPLNDATNSDSFDSGTLADDTSGALSGDLTPASPQPTTVTPAPIAAPKPATAQSVPLQATDIPTRTTQPPAPAPLERSANVGEDDDTTFFSDASTETTEEADTAFFEDTEIPAANLAPQPSTQSTDPLSRVTLVAEAHSWQ